MIGFMINLNTSLNQHSKLKFVFYSYARVLLGNIPYPKFVFYLHNYDCKHSLDDVSCFGTLKGIDFPKI